LWWKRIADIIIIIIIINFITVIILITISTINIVVSTDNFSNLISSTKIKKLTEGFSAASTESGLTANGEKNEYILKSCEEESLQNHQHKGS
jgi:oligoribonuclease (3'-5' exoribonuclease)